MAITKIHRRTMTTDSGAAPTRVGTSVLWAIGIFRRETA
jgi:hypothetical protein